MRVDWGSAALGMLLAGILCGVLACVVQACLNESMWLAGGRLMGEVWFRATLADCYGAFTIAWLAIAFREQNLPRSLAWLMVAYLTGSIGLAAYWLWALARKPAGADWRNWMQARRNH